MLVRVTISRIEGVQSVEPNPIAQNATIVFDDTKTNPKVFIKALEGQGLQVLGEPEYIK
jgi:copper chaperone CopZ